MRRPALTLTAVAAAALALAAAALAGTPGTWTRVTDPDGRNLNQAGLARTPDGVLHVVWVRKSGTEQDLVHTPISPAGIAGASTPVVKRWDALTNASIVATSGGLEVFFSGLRTSSSTDPYASGTVYTATAPPSGAAWTLGPPAAPPSNAYASDLVAATTGKGASTAWDGTFGTLVHLGTDPAAPSIVVQKACCGYQPGLGTDSKTGEVVVAWFSNATGGQGMHVRTVAPALGPDRYLPGSGDAGRKSAVSPDQQVAATGRIGAPGVYVAYGLGYPSWRSLVVWNASTGGSIPIFASRENGTLQHFSIAPGPDGRLWVMWSDYSRLYAARSNRAATRYGATVTIAPPGGTTTIWKAQGEGSRGPLDLLGSFTTGGGLSFWHTQVAPGLTLEAKLGATSGQAQFVVLDAGDPVKGATVKVGGKTLTTGAAGVAATTLPAGRYGAVASAPGYTAANAAIRIPAKAEA